mmetsp:Transcript_18011/g.46045  ORF Transcript_18011/g.46045 Transcript_18011/m.46045 type:complete len:159 (+) Transcript_18011:84-560(+)|eukprot:CAMPEP_0115855236 /NCGR_PEP_ID=MMETSP0287-20121206/14439_1 /TAXON_ID=412157 /ORGANISM="Chrysochromulina rotalis, Strain UIO044" /LENGTH=158 /DNA_ID=CAMNT_0003309385 /DNA_START=80 /DNA_END=556 /DNA_ORIENTATION=+
MDDALLMISGRIRRGWQAFMFLDVPERVETFALLSFACCLLGSLGIFPVSVNLAVALLGLVAARSHSDAQLLGLCGFVAFTIATDIMQLFRCSAWGASMLAVNVVLKFGAASNAYRMVGEPGPDDGLSTAESPGGYTGASYQAPLGNEDNPTTVYRAV